VEERINPTPTPAAATPPAMREYSAAPVASAPVASAGGTFSPLPVRDPTARPSGPRPIQTVTVHAYTQYTCQTGDTLQSICQRAYGSERYANALFNYNRRDAAPNTISEFGDIKVGANLFLPDKKHLEDAYGALIGR
jgi:nucleoid-associated protein YgaU